MDPARLDGPDAAVRFPSGIPLTIGGSAAGHLAGVISTLGQLLGPTAATDAPPPWLWPEQIGPFRELVAAVREFGGALLALPVGSGKTWVVLGAARALGPGALVDVVAPAVLGPQWQRTAERAGVPIRFASHEAVSLGRFSAGTGPVVIDESHRFRNPDTKRYRALAPTLIGRPVVLVTATPVVNRLGDLAAQLALGCRDDALSLEDVPSLARALGGRRREASVDVRQSSPETVAGMSRRPGPLPWGIGRLVVTSRQPGVGMPDAIYRTVGWWKADRYLGWALPAIDRLKLSRNRAIARLIRTSLVRAAASSPAALAGALTRYAGLLTHARAARLAGHRLSRAAVRRAIAGAPDQLLLWDVLPSDPEPGDLATSDGPAVERLRVRIRGSPNGSDGKLVGLQNLLEDRVPSLVFCTAVETVHYLRRRLGLGGLAWLTGSAAGWGTHRCARRLVLEAFDPAARPDAGLALPWLLLASDVAAEGLDLQRVRRVVHYDLPWTAVRLEQRAGRARRLGSPHREVEVVRFEVPPAIEERLALLAVLDRKGGLPDRVGLTGPLRDVIERRTRLAGQVGDARAVEGWIGAETGRWSVVGIRLSAGNRHVGLVAVRDPSGRWTEAPDTVERALSIAAAASERNLSDGALDEVLGSLGQWLAERLAGALTTTLIGPTVPTGAGLSQRPAGVRKVVCGPDTVQSEAVLRFLRRGHTAGEAMIQAALVAGDAVAWRRAAGLGGPDRSAAIAAHVVALVGGVG